MDQFGHLAVPMEKADMALIDSTPTVEYLILSCRDCHPQAVSSAQCEEENSKEKRKKQARNSKKQSETDSTKSGVTEESPAQTSPSEYYVICIPKTDMDILKKEGMMFKNISTVSD